MRTKFFSLVFFFTQYLLLGQVSQIGTSTLSDDNLRINISFENAVYPNSSCNSNTLFSVDDFTLQLSGGNAQLLSSTPLSIARLGNFDFSTMWSGGEPNNAGGRENFVQITGGTRLNDLSDQNRLAVIEVVSRTMITIPNYTYLGSYPASATWAHTYYISNDRKLWVDHRADALALGQSLNLPIDLAIFNDQDELNYLFNNFPQVDREWIGLYQDLGAYDYTEPDGGWYWVDGTPINNFSTDAYAYQITFGITGTPNGNEVITINPVNNQVFNCAGQAMSNQYDGRNQVRLNDRFPPKLLRTSINPNNSKIILEFDDQVYRSTTQDPLLATDFELALSTAPGQNISLTQNTPLAIDYISPSIVALDFGLNKVTPIIGSETLTVSLVLGSMIYDEGGNVFTGSSFQANLNPTKTGPVYVSISYFTIPTDVDNETRLKAYLCSQLRPLDYNPIYHNGENLLPEDGNYIIFNNAFSYGNRILSGEEYAVFHLRDFDKIVEVHKETGYILNVIDCN